MTFYDLKKFKVEILFSLIMLFAVGLRLYFFNGIRGHDDHLYLIFIRSYINGSTDIMFHNSWGLRFALLFPVILLFKIFTPGYFLAFLPTFLLSIGSLSLIYFTALKIFKSKSTALLSMFLLSFFPIDTFVATTIRGDTEVGFYIALSLLLFFYSNTFALTSKTSKKQIIFLLLSGIAVGLAYSSKELGIIAIVGFFFLFLFDSISSKKIKWNYSIIIAGFLVFYLSETILIGLLSGNWFERFDKGFLLYNSYFERGDYLKDKTLSLLYLPCLMFNITSKTCTEITGGGAWENTYTTLGAFYFYIFLGILFLLFKKDKNSYPLIIFTAAVLIYFQFGSVSPYHYVPFHKEPRYLIVISVPVLLLLGRGLVLFYTERFYKKLIIIASLILLLGSSLSILNRYHTKYTEFSRVNPLLYEFIMKRKEKNFYMDSFSKEYIDLRSGYAFRDPIPAYNFKGKKEYGNLIELNFLNCRNIHNSYLIRTKTGLKDYYENVFGDKPCFKNIPHGWIKLQDLKQDNSSAEVYFIP